MLPPLNFPPIEVVIPNCKRLTAQEEELKTLKKLINSFHEWQAKVEYVLEQNGIFLHQTSQENPDFTNDGSTYGMKILSCTSLSGGVPVDESSNAEDDILHERNQSAETLDGDSDLDTRLLYEVEKPEEPDEPENRLNSPVDDIESSVDSELAIDLYRVSHDSVRKRRAPNLAIECNSRSRDEESRATTGESTTVNPPVRLLRSNSASRKRTASTDGSYQTSDLPESSELPDRNGQSNRPQTVKKLRLTPEHQEALNHIDLILTGKQAKFQCKICSYAGKENDVLTHIRMSHIGRDRKFSCPHCTYRFKKEIHLINHVESKHPGQPKIMPSSSSLNIVLRRDENNFNIVKTSDKSLKAKRNHGSVISSKKKSSNGKVSRTEEDVEREIRSTYEVFHESSNISYLCIACGQLFDEEIMVRLHIKQTHKCAFCPEIFTNAVLLENHVRNCGRLLASTRMSTEDLNYLSSTSTHYLIGPTSTDSETDNSRKRSYAFNEVSKMEADKHIINVKSTRPPYKCAICATVFNSTRQTARIHIRTKHPELLAGLE